MTRGKILVVEDYPELRRAIGCVLAVEGYEVVQASDGVQALKTLGELSGPWFALIVDYVLPNLDGAVLIREVRSRKILFRKVILYTVLDRDDPRISSLFDEGPLDYVSKGESDALSRHIVDILSH